MRKLTDMDRNRRTLPTFVAVYALLYAAFGLQSPFLPALLRERGLPADQLGLVLGAATAVRVLVGPAIGHAADHLRRHTFMLCACSLAAAVATVGYALVWGFLPLLVVGLVHAAMLAPIVPISDALATTASQESQSRQRGRFDYGWLRASGSAAFVIGTTLGGWALGKTGLGTMPSLSGVVLAIGGVVALSLPAIPGRRPISTGSTSTVRDWALLLQIAIYRRVLVVAALVEGSHALNDAFSVIRWREAGIDLLAIGVLWSESVLSEVLVFLLIGPRLLRFLGPAGACTLAAGAGAVRWTIMASTTSPVALGLVQPLHGLTFALLHLACMRLIVRTVPIRLAATAQAIYGTVCIGMATALLTLISGLLYERLGGYAFLAMAALCALGMPMCSGLRAPDRPLQSERTL